MSSSSLRSSKKERSFMTRSDFVIFSISQISNSIIINLTPIMNICNQLRLLNRKQLYTRFWIYIMRKALLIFSFLFCFVHTQNTNQQQATNEAPNTQQMPRMDRTQASSIQVPQSDIDAADVKVITSEELAKKVQEDKRKKQQEIERRRADPELRAQLEKQERETAERTAKYRAQQERIRALRKKQKEAQQKRKAEMQIKDDEKVAFEQDKSESQTNKVRGEERSQVFQVLNGSRMTHEGKKIMFECNKKIQEFIINPSVDEEMALTFSLYIEQNNVFSYVKDVTKQEPLKLFVYEDNTRIVTQSTFYFENAVKFNVKGGSKYVLRFYNSGSLKLVSMTYTHFIGIDAASKMYNSQKGKTQLNLATNLMGGIQQTIEQLSQSQVIDYRNSKALIDSISKYFGYQVIEIIFVVTVCIVQIHFIKKMFSSVSIL